MNQSQSKKRVTCGIKNCQKEITLEDALEIDGRYFCKTCGVQYYRNLLKL